MRRTPGASGIGGRRFAQTGDGGFCLHIGDIVARKRKLLEAPHVEGNTKSGITLVEYGDYQCPFCGQYFPIVKQVQAEFNDQIAFQFRNFPLVSVHQNAFAGARAAEAAALQGKFWEMHDLLYQNQSQWSEGGDPTSFFKQYALQLGLNVDQFNKDYASTKVNNAINADMISQTSRRVRV